jgi:hypothetical protein
MSTLEDVPLGPIDIVVIGYPPGSSRTGEGLPILLDLVDRGTIRLLDALAVEKDADGTVTSISMQDVDGDGFPDLVMLEGATSGLIGDDDVATAAAALEPDSAAVLLVYENTWAAPFAAAVRRSGGELLAFDRVAAADLEEAVDRLESTPSQ